MELIPYQEEHLCSHAERDGPALHLSAEFCDSGRMLGCYTEVKVARVDVPEDIAKLSEK